MKTKLFNFAFLLLFNMSAFRLIAQPSNVFLIPLEAQEAYQASNRVAADRKHLVETPWTERTNFLTGRRFSPRDAAEYSKIEVEAENGDATSQLKLGDIYADELMKFKDDGHWLEAEKWYRKAAEKGSVESQLHLGVIYKFGYGVKADEKEANKWFQTAYGYCSKAAETNNAEAQCFLGDIFESGQGVEMNRPVAFGWYKKAAAQNYAKAESKIGFCYLIGIGVQRDRTEWLKWLAKAAEHGDKDAQEEIADVYYRGYDGIGGNFRLNKQDTFGWYQRLAEQGKLFAQLMVARCYGDGDGVVKDEIESYKWWLLAAAQGDQKAKHYISVSESRLTRDQIAEGQKLARNFKPRKALGSDASTTGNEVSSSTPKASGSGFFITADGYLISNNHVVEGANKVRLRTGAGLTDATVVKVDTSNDLALLKVEGKFSPLPIAASRMVKLGSTVATVGFPDIGLQGFAPKLAKGEIASLAGAVDDPRYFQISLPVQHGNSGGALVDVHGNVVGIVAAKLGVEIGNAVTSDELPENVNYAVKSSLLLSFLESVPEVSAKLKEPNTKDAAFEDVVKSAQDAAVLVLVY